MTRAERILELSLLIDELKAEQRITEWLELHTSVQVWTAQDFDGGAHFICTVIRHGQIIAHARGNNESDARAQAFNVVFTNEAAERAG
jgi:hypothetical protein